MASLISRTYICLCTQNNSYAYEIMLANKMLTLPCLYLHFWSVGSGERPKIQGTSVSSIRHAIYILQSNYFKSSKQNLFVDFLLMLLPFLSSCYIADYCEPDCTNGGRCDNGVCVCPAGFHGPACEYG